MLTIPQATSAAPKSAPQAASPAPPAPPRTGSATDVGQSIEKAVEDAVRAAQEAASQPGLTRTERRDQIRAQVDRALREAGVRGRDGTPISISLQDPSNVIPPQAVDMAIAFFVMTAVVIIGLPLARAFARRMDRRSMPAAVDPDLAPRLERIEQAVEAVAIEIERISEGQRYATKVMSELRGLPAPASAGWPAGSARAEPVSVDAKRG